MQNLGDVIKSLQEIERVSKNSYVILASAENDEERMAKQQLQEAIEGENEAIEEEKKIPIMSSKRIDGDFIVQGLSFSGHVVKIS